MAKRKKAKRRAANKRGHHVTVRLSPEEMAVAREVAKLARVDIAALLRVVLALRIAQAMPMLGPGVRP